MWRRQTICLHGYQRWCCRCWRTRTRPHRSRHGTWENSSPQTLALTWELFKFGFRTGCFSSDLISWWVVMVICRRAKEKRLKKDAGRARWGQYFRWDQRSKTISTNLDNWLELFFQNQIISHCLIWKRKKFSFWFSLVSRGLKGPLSPGREKRAGKFESIIKSLWNNHQLSLTKMTLILRNR